MPNSGLACTFCAHGNPEGSKYCNECGSPLHLAPCPECEAINKLSDRQCFQCGATLPLAATEELPALAEASAATEARPTPAEAAAASASDAATAPMYGDPVPMALADRLESSGWDPRPTTDEPLHMLNESAFVTGVSVDRSRIEDRSAFAELPADRANLIEEGYSRTAVAADRTAAVEEDRFFANAAADDASPVEESPSDAPPIPRAAYDAPNRRRAGALVIGIVFVAAATGAVYWFAVSPSRPGTSGTAADAPSSTAEPAPRASEAPPKSTDVAPQGNSASPATTNAPQTTGAVPQATDSPAREASESRPASQSAAAPVRNETAAPLEQTAKPDGRATGETARPDNRPRTVTQTRTKEQAERDALATRRLIERELGTAPPAD